MSGLRPCCFAAISRIHAPIACSTRSYASSGARLVSTACCLCASTGRIGSVADAAGCETLVKLPSGDYTTANFNNASNPYGQDLSAYMTITSGTLHIAPEPATLGLLGLGFLGLGVLRRRRR